MKIFYIGFLLLGASLNGSECHCPQTTAATTMDHGTITVGTHTHHVVEGLTTAKVSPAKKESPKSPRSFWNWLWKPQLHITDLIIGFVFGAVCVWLWDRGANRPRWR